MPASFKLYRFLEDAWADGLRAWCEDASEKVLSGEECWMSLVSAGQTQWIKRRALQDGVCLFGIRFLQPAMLRFELCSLLGIETRALGRETLQFILKVNALRAPTIDSCSLADSPADWLDALEQLESCGWGGSAASVLPGASRELSRILEDSRAWGPALDNELFLASGLTSGGRLNTCFVGWDAAYWGFLPLLDAVFRASIRSNFYQALPRSTTETLQQNWVRMIEKKLGTQSEPCKASDFRSVNEPLVSRLEATDLDPFDGQAPRFLVGAQWLDQMTLARDYVVRRVAAMPLGQRLGIVTPRRGPSSLEMARTLAHADIRIFDATGENEEPETEVLIQLEIIRYHLLCCDAESLLALVVLLNERGSGSWPWLNPRDARDCMHGAFKISQTRNARMLVHSLEPAKASEQMRGLVEALGLWPDEMTWSEARLKWELTVNAFEISLESMEPAWSLIAELPGGDISMTSESFLEYLRQLLSGSRLRRHKDADWPNASVVITTFSQACRQSWDELVFLDCNEGDWPVKQTENCFLDDAACRDLNARRTAKHGYILGSPDRSALEQSQFLDLIENCRGQIALAAVASKEGEETREAYPNEWVIRGMVESATDESACASVSKSWRQSAWICPRPFTSIPDADRDHLVAIHASRRDPSLPFDEYHFNFRACRLPQDRWSATSVDDMVTSPASMALSRLFNAESEDEAEFTRSEKWMVGTHAHAWLKEAFAGGAEYKPLPVSRDLFSALQEAVAQTRKRLEDLFCLENLVLPLWWQSTLRKAAWNAWKCVSAVPKDAGTCFLMEHSISEDVETYGGLLQLKGRVDLLISDRAGMVGADVLIIDFKTGKASPPTLGSLDRGSGFQFASYLLLAKALGAASARVAVIRSENGMADVFSDVPEDELRRKMGGLARMQRECLFGQAGPLVTEWGKCESLPMATTPIDPRILDEKRKLSIAQTAES